MIAILSAIVTWAVSDASAAGRPARGRRRRDARGVALGRVRLDDLRRLLRLHRRVRRLRLREPMGDRGADRLHDPRDAGADRLRPRFGPRPRDPGARADPDPDHRRRHGHLPARAAGEQRGAVPGPLRAGSADRDRQLPDARQSGPPRDSPSCPLRAPAGPDRHGPRRLQAGQRHARPSAGRRAPLRGRGRAHGRGPGPRHRGPAGRRRVRRDRPRDERRGDAAARRAAAREGRVAGRGRVSRSEPRSAPPTTPRTPIRSRAC